MKGIAEGEEPLYLNKRITTEKLQTLSSSTMKGLKSSKTTEQTASTANTGPNTTSE